MTETNMEPCLKLDSLWIMIFKYTVCRKYYKL